MANRRPPGPLAGALHGVDFPAPCNVGNVSILMRKRFVCPEICMFGIFRETHVNQGDQSADELGAASAAAH